MINEPTSATIRLEVCKISYKQTREGDVITFRIHPDDKNNDLANMPLGEIVTLVVTPSDIGA